MIKERCKEREGERKRVMDIAIVQIYKLKKHDMPKLKINNDNNNI